MAADESGSILIIGPAEAPTAAGQGERAFGRSLAGEALKSVPVDALKSSVSRLFDQLEDILDTGRERVGQFEVSEITVDAEITADGQIGILGTGAKVGVKGGVRFVLKRVPRSP